ncbi:MAG: hypothetical protein OXB84_04030 [Halobacteriovoraceae bacterium]|nr:hypothetical protein [Halobacteriovoraceae bacterium]
MRPKNITTFHEFRGYISNGEYKSDPASRFNPQEIKFLRHLSENLIPRGKIFDIGPDSIRARNDVGVISFGRHQIEILPKLLGRSGKKSSIIENLTHMLSYTDKMPVFDNEIGSLSSSQLDFLDIYIKIFAQKLSSALKRGIPHRYIIERDNLNFIKGKILIKENIKKNFIQKERIFCEYGSFSENNIINQTFRSVLEKILPLTRNDSIRPKLKHCLRYLADVKKKNITYHNIKAIKISKANAHVSEVFEMAKFFLKGLRQELSSGHEKVHAIIFDMNELFEEFIFKFLESKKSILGIKEISFQRRKRLITDVTDLFSNKTSRKGLMDTYLDIFITLKDGKKVIIDTKYKLLNEDGQHHFNIKNADIYQMCTYQGLYGYEKRPEILLLYPQNKKSIYKALGLGGNLDKVLIANINLHEKLALNGHNHLVQTFKKILDSISSRDTFEKDLTS